MGRTKATVLIFLNKADDYSTIQSSLFKKNGSV